MKHCKGRVRYWQNDAEPNNPVFWSGTKEEFVTELKLFSKAVKEADPAAVVVLGGYDGMFVPPGTPGGHPFPNQQADSANGPKEQIGNLYKDMSSLAPETQMFLLDCPPQLDAKYQRIQARGLVMRNLLAFSAGVQKTLYWQFLNAHADRDDLMTLMYGKIGMVGYEQGELKRRYMLADVFASMTKILDGVREVKRVSIAEKPSIFLFKVNRGRKAPVFVVWERRDAFSGEDFPA